MTVVWHVALLGFAVGSFVPVRLAAQATPNRLQLVEDVRIRGSVEGFSVIQWIAVGPSGRLAIWEPQESRATIYSITGKRLGTVGGPGEGPGEFRPAGLGGWIGDTLWIADHAPRRTSLFAGGLKYLRSEPFPEALRAPTPQRVVGALIPRARFRDGSLLLSVTLADGARLPGAGANVTSRFAFVRSTSTGVVRHVVGWRDPQVECWRGEVHVPLCAEEVHGLAPDGEFLAVASLARTGDEGASFRVTVLAASGDTVWRREYPYTPVVIPGSGADSARRAVARAITRVPPELRAEAQGIRVPKVYPPVRQVLVGADGIVWLKRDDGRMWLVVDQKGTPRGTVVVPTSLELRQVSGSDAWGVDYDADGLPNVVHFRLQAGGPR